MKFRKSLYAALAAVMLFGGTSSYAAEYDILSKDLKTEHYTFGTFLEKDSIFSKIKSNPSEYFIQYTSYYYSVKKIQIILSNNPNYLLKDATKKIDGNPIDSANKDIRKGVTYYKANFVVKDKATNAPITDAKIVVKDSSKKKITDLTKLAPGEYTYTVNKANYKEATGTFKVVDKDVTVPDILLEKTAAAAEVSSVKITTPVSIFTTTTFGALQLDVTTTTNVALKAKVFDLTSQEMPAEKVRWSLTGATKSNTKIDKDTGKLTVDPAEPKNTRLMVAAESVTKPTVMEGIAIYITR